MLFTCCLLQGDFEEKARSIHRDIVSHVSMFFLKDGHVSILARCSTSLIIGGLYLNNNNQAFYSQASWGRLEMKPHEPIK
jgi:hypothetical protein